MSAVSYSAVQKLMTECKDIWRKVVLPALLDGREWSAPGSGAWDTKAKIEVLVTVLKVSIAVVARLTSRVSALTGPTLPLHRAGA